MAIKLNKKNPVIKDLYSKKFKPKVVKPKKGKGSFKRKKKRLREIKKHLLGLLKLNIYTLGKIGLDYQGCV